VGLVEKYRPFKSEDLAGQRMVKSLFKEQSKEMSFKQSIFMLGTTGTGKTTTSRILSALLQCDNPIVSKEGYKEPCGNCASCKDIKTGDFKRDVKMFDGSNLGIDKMKEIEASLKLRPLYDKNKVIIFDEAQNISGTGQTKFLSMIEKEYDNVYFIINSMKPKVFSQAVLDRGQKFYFKELSIDDIARYMFDIVEKEEFEVPDSFISNSLFTLAEIGQGSLRGAIANLETCIDGKIFDNNDICEYFDYVTKEKLTDFLIKLLDKDSAFFNIDGKNSKEFFYLSYETLYEALIYKRTKVVKVGWKENLYKTVSSYSDKDLELILKLYNKVYEVNNQFFKNAYYFGTILEYFKTSEGRIKRPVRQVRGQ